MTGAHSGLRRYKPLWMSAWPLWTLAVFASLAVVRLLPDGYIRAVVAAPILLMVPGSLTLGVVFGQHGRPRGAAFLCYAALLGTVWSVFASLALYARGVLITSDSTFWCLLVVSAVLAVAAEVRLLLGRPGEGRRVARKPEAQDPDLFDAAADDAETSTAVRDTGYYAFLAVVAGVVLLAGGLYASDHLPQPAPTGYTWMAWTKPPTTRDIPIGPGGTKLSFQIVHRQPDTTTFRLNAEWLGDPSRPLAQPVTLNIGPNQTFRGALYVPALPNGCTYRIVVALTAAGQPTPKPQTWSINADVHDPSKSPKTCK